MTFSDIFKSKFLTNFNSLSAIDIVLALIISFALGLFIYFIYKKTYNGVMYSESFGISLMAMSMITSVVIISVTSNVVLSLGMVGALSIVRFRTAIKEPMDIAFLFWAIVGGIVTGAKLYLLGITGSLLIGLVIYLFSKRKTIETPYILVINLENTSGEDEVKRIVSKETKKNILKSKTVSCTAVQLTYEIRTPNDNSEFINNICNCTGVRDATMVSYNGEYMC